MKKKKPTHSVFSNFAWSLKMLLKYSKAAFFITALFIPINIGLRYLEIYLPSLVVSEVTNGQTINHALLSSGSDPTGLKSPVITGLFKDLSHSWQRNGNNTSLFNNKELTDFD